MRVGRRELHVPFESPLPPRLRWLPTALAVVVVGVPVAVAVRLGAPPVQHLVTALVSAGLAAALLLRIRMPRAAALCAIAVATATVPFVGVGVVTPGPLVAGILAVMITVFRVGSRLGRNPALVIAAIAVAAIGLALLIVQPPQSRGVESLITLLALVGVATMGGIARNRGHAYIEAITERARRAEETRESEAERRVAEERLAIARDLHDVMAHQIAVINLSAAAASQALRDRPDDAERSLATVREAARSVLGEIGELLTVLRSADAPTGAPLAPGPGLARLPELVEDFRNSGLQVERRTFGDVVELDSLRDIVAYRLVQEALTNAHKHGADGSALLQFDYAPDHVEVTVTNVTRAETDDRVVIAGGHGLVGARERVAAVGGRLETSFGPGPVHRFVAHLPVTSPASASSDETDKNEDPA
jgi:signal transduction histidine kinase